MYIKRLEINNFCSISHFSMEFENPAGWHVLIGDNGAGKSSIIKATAMALVGPDEIAGIRPNWNDFLQWKAKSGRIGLDIETDARDEQPEFKNISRSKYKVSLQILREEADRAVLDMRRSSSTQLQKTIWGNNRGWFSAGYGPFRRFTGGSTEMEKVFDNPSFSRLASHLSLFREDVALTEITKWLMNIKFQTLERKLKRSLLDQIKKFINSTDFLPHDTRLDDVSSDGVCFIDGNKAKIFVNQLSDGYRSILSLTFELIRQLIRVYGEEEVFRMVDKNKMIIDLPGIVLIDEVDAHLHPTWQTRIGSWFLKYFPNIQFIVTTHSPLICRASENGTIWRLAEPGSNLKSQQIIGLEKNRLIYGNILDAYGTEVFGKSITISKAGNEKRTRLGELNIKSLMGKKINTDEFEDLKRIFPTEKMDLK